MIQFFCEDIDFGLNKEKEVITWLQHIANQENKTIHILNYIFCSDSYLHKINLDYLSHDTFTDIITFDNNPDDEKIEGDIFISLDRVRDNAKTFKATPEDELHRVIAHGLLHLLGYKDKTEDEQTVMRQKEEACLSLLH